MNTIDNLLTALRKIGVTDIPLDMLSISENVQAAQELMDKINNGQISNITDLVSYFGKIPDSKYEKMFSNSITVVDVDPSELQIISDETEKKKSEEPVLCLTMKKEDEQKSDSEHVSESADRSDPVSEQSGCDVMDKTSVLWKYKSVPESEPEPFPEYIKKYEKLDGAAVTAARVRGRKHKHEGTNCDDWFETQTAGKWIISAVSDGAGSRKFSRIGSSEACRAAVSFIQDFLLNKADSSYEQKLALPMNDPQFMSGCSYYAKLIQDAVAKAYESLKSAFDDRKTKYDHLKSLGRDMEVRDLACTLLICMMVPVTVNDKKEHFVITCQIGDGMICSVNKNADFDTALKLLGEADSGEYSGETDFITSDSARKPESLMGKTRIMRGVVSDIILMTDGVADDYFPNSPQMLRLYIDLMLNGIIQPIKCSQEAQSGVAEKIPEPVCYPWVNDNEVKIAVQYAGRVAKGVSLTLKEFWGKPEIIKAACLDPEKYDLPGQPDERLERWLDNYSERGSFDDRTAVIISVDSDK